MDNNIKQEKEKTWKQYEKDRYKIEGYKQANMSNREIAGSMIQYHSLKNIILIPFIIL